MFIITMAGATCAAALLTLGRVVGFKRIIKHATLVDVVFSIGVVAVMGATMTGALTAVIAGLFMAITLSMAKSVAAVLGFLPGLAKKAQTMAAEHSAKTSAEWGDVTPRNAPPVPDVPTSPPNVGTGRPVLIML
ncbi:hypothetical protein SAMN05216227_102026 [Pseudorhodobacter antarcticus]|uniref:Uncharacterized protein n=1 Tax=Pseudorhodobacter antarcticus TaxID=1077947 RepID=A0A1H8IG77_9RHOB|nr:hypothetical protein [Pseudorhodobacter antarcticus]SEN67279.1 hypothetical protein SAMN05216227_102026 [Pseudorhodobacter antarcticus]